MQIRAALFDGDAPRVVTAELPEPGPDQVLVRLVATGICHTDAKAARPGGPVPHPVVLGHEGAGIVEATGARVTRLRPGDHVVLTFASCGACPSCLDAEPAHCHETFPRNFSCPARIEAEGRAVHAGFFGQSSFATHALATERNAIPVPADVPLELLGPLGCGIQTGAGAILNDFRPRAGDTLAVFGTGSVGLSAIMAATLAGVTIIAVDRDPRRLDLARELGAVHAILAGDEPMAPQVLGLAPGGVRFALDTTGALPVMRAAIDVLAPRGEAGFVTAPWDGAELGVPVRQLLVGRRLRGIHQGSSNPHRFIPRLIGLWQAGRFPFDRLVTFYPFEDIARALAGMADGRTIKPVLRFS
jgi:aryl-alcohol dehydrogenase